MKNLLKKDQTALNTLKLVGALSVGFDNLLLWDLLQESENLLLEASSRKDYKPQHTTGCRGG